MTATDQDWAARARAGTNGHTEDESKRQLKVTTATDIAMKATRWLWKDDRAHWLAMGSLVGLAGREGVGKSTWCAYLTALITRGELPGDFYGTAKGVIICTTEDDWSATLKPRLEAAGADMSRVHRLDAVGADGLEEIVTLPNDLIGMEQIIREKNVALVILDPLLTFVNKKLDTHKDAEVRRALEPVVRMAHDTKASVIGLSHVNKTSEGDLMNRVTGSRAIGAVARGVLFCGSYRPVEDMASEDDSPFVKPDLPKRARFVFGQSKNNLQAKVMHSVEYHIQGKTVGYDQEAQKDVEGSYLVLDRTHTENVEDIILEQEKRAKATKTGGSKAEGWLVAYLTGKGEVPANQLFRDADEAGLSRNQVYPARRS
jgi:RecA-family ATPase